MNPGILKRVVGELFSPAMVVALLALAISIGGSAYAAKLITSKDIKNNTVATKDLKNGGIKLTDLGPGVKSAISDTWDPSAKLVSGRTITGSVYFKITAGASGVDLVQSVAFPARAPEPLSSLRMGPDSLAATTDDDVCAGTYEAPTAPPGTLCAYAFSAGNVSSLDVAGLFPGMDHGFVIRLEPAAAGLISVDLTWAYTAP